MRKKVKFHTSENPRRLTDKFTEMAGEIEHVRRMVYLEGNSIEDNNRSFQKKIFRWIKEFRSLFKNLNNLSGRMRASRVYDHADRINEEIHKHVNILYRPTKIQQHRMCNKITFELAHLLAYFQGDRTTPIMIVQM